MAIVEYTVNIATPVQDVYRITQDYSIRYHWDPFPEHIEMLGGANEVAKGVRALVVAKSGLRMEVEFIQVAPPRAVAIKMTKGPIFLETFAGSWVLDADGPAATRVKFIYSIKSKWWALPWIADQIGAAYFSGAIRKRLDGLKVYCESDQR